MINEDGTIGVSLVDDCLNLMQILLSKKTNQKYFVEIGCIKFFDIQSGGHGGMNGGSHNGGSHNGGSIKNYYNDIK